MVRWRDLSGNGRHVVQNNPAYQPSSYGRSATYPVGATYWTGRREMVAQNRADQGLDFSTSPNGLSFFTAYQFQQSSLYYIACSLFSKINYAWMVPSIASQTIPSAATAYLPYGWQEQARPIDDDTGYDIWTNKPSYYYYGVPTAVASAGMRIVTSKAPESTPINPQFATVGIRFDMQISATTTSPHIDFNANVQYMYNYYPIPAGGYNGVVQPGGTASYAAGTWLLDACRGVNTGTVADQCWALLLSSNPAAAVNQAAYPGAPTSIPVFAGGNWANGWAPGMPHNINTYYGYYTPAFIAPMSNNYNPAPTGSVVSKGDGLASAPSLRPAPWAAIRSPRASSACLTPTSTSLRT